QLSFGSPVYSNIGSCHLPSLTEKQEAQPTSRDAKWYGCCQGHPAVLGRRDEAARRRCEAYERREGGAREPEVLESEGEGQEGENPPKPAEQAWDEYRQIRLGEMYESDRHAKADWQRGMPVGHDDNREEYRNDREPRTHGASKRPNDQAQQPGPLERQ